MCAEGLRSEIDVVGLDLGVERGGVHSEESGSSGLMTTRLLERAANEVDFKSSNFFVEVYAAGDEERLADLAAALHMGPRMARVRSVDEQDAAIEKLAGFAIR